MATTHDWYTVVADWNGSGDYAWNGKWAVGYANPSIPNFGCGSYTMRLIKGTGWRIHNDCGLMIYKGPSSTVLEPADRLVWKGVEAAYGSAVVTKHYGDPNSPPTHTPTAHPGSWKWNPVGGEWIWIESGFMQPVDGVNPDAPTALTVEPINVINGCMVSDATDAVIPAPGPDLEFNRFYRSCLVSTVGPLGSGWVHSYEWHVEEATNTYDAGEFVVTNRCLEVRTGQGNCITLMPTGQGDVWQGYREVNWTACKTNDGYRLQVGGGTEYAFDADGALTSVSDAWGNGLSLEYSGGLLTRVEHSNGQHLDLSYTNERLIELSTPSTNLYVRYTYNSLGELTNVTRSLSSGSFSTSYAYDSSGHHRLVEWVDACGDVFSYSYPSGVVSRCNGMVLGSNKYEHSVAYEVHAGTSVVTYVRKGANQSYTYGYDTNVLRVTTIAGPGSAGPVTSYARDPVSLNVTNERIEEASCGEWIEIRRKYDASGYVTNECLGYCAQPADGWSYTWDTNDSLVTSVKDPEGCKTVLEYTNGLVSRASICDGGGVSYDTVYAYAGGLLIAATSANGHGVRYEYDSFGRLNKIVPQAGPAMTCSHDVLGNLEWVSMPGDAGARTTVFESDELGRVSRITYPNGLTEEFAYDAMGNVTNHRDTAGRATRCSYAAGGKLTATVRALGTQEVAVRFDYDNQFNMLRVMDALDRAVESYRLDLQDRPVAVTNLEGQVMKLTYGMGGFIKSVTRFDGTVVSNEYDGNGRLSCRHFVDGDDGFTYYPNGLLRTAGNNAGTVSNAYSGANRLVLSEGATPACTVSYSYLPAGQVSNLVMVAGEYRHAYDEADRITGLFAPDGAFEWAYSTNNGLIAELSCVDSGVRASYEYDVLDRIQAIVWRDAGEQVLMSCAYSYDDAGMIVGIVRETGGEFRYVYDELDRLVQETELSPAGKSVSSATYAYDLAGNREEKTEGSLVVSYAFPGGEEGNRLSDWSVSDAGSDPCGTMFVFDGHGAGAPEKESEGGDRLVMGEGSVRDFWEGATNAVYRYDAAGCLTNVIVRGEHGRQSVSLAWNSHYQLVSVATNGIVVEKYGYDALGRRIWIWAGVSTNYLVYDGVHVLAEVGGDGSLRTSYTYGPGVDNILGMSVHGESGTESYYFLTDHLGSVHGVVDDSGEIVERYRYDAWGRVVGVYDSAGVEIPKSQVGNRFLWQGREYSWRTGFYYFRARWYDPLTGRWLSKDPIGIAGGLNQYAAFLENPMMSRDPIGLVTVITHGIWTEGGWMGQFRNEIGGRTLLYRWSGSLTATALEHLNLGRESRKLAQFIEGVHRAYPDEPINIVAHSGGGQISINAAEKLSGVHISNIVLLGAPVDELAVGNVGTVWDFSSWGDPLSWNIDFRRNVKEVDFSGIGHLEWYYDRSVINRIREIITTTGSESPCP